MQEQPRGEGGQLETEEGSHAHKTVEEHKEKPSIFPCIICQNPNSELEM